MNAKPGVLVMMLALGNPKCLWHSRLIFAKKGAPQLHFKIRYLICDIKTCLLHV